MSKIGPMAAADDPIFDNLEVPKELIYAMFREYIQTDDLRVPSDRVAAIRVRLGIGSNPKVEAYFMVLGLQYFTSRFKTLVS